MPVTRFCKEPKLDLQKYPVVFLLHKVVEKVSILVLMDYPTKPHIFRKLQLEHKSLMSKLAIEKA